MKNYFYYNVIRKATMQFLDALNDIKIARYNSDGTIRKYIKVPLKYAPKGKNYSWLFSKNPPGNKGYQDKKHIILPQMALHMVGVDYDRERQVNKEMKITISESPSAAQIERIFQPVPYNIDYELNIFTLNVDDVNQIVEQILPYFAPEIPLYINIPQLDTTLMLKLIYQSSSPDMDPNIEESNLRVVKWDMSFQLQAYLFKPLELTPTIQKIIMPIYTDTTLFNNRLSTEDYPPSGADYTLRTWTDQVNREYIGDYDENIFYDIIGND